MTSLADFVAIGKECGLAGDKLLEFAKAELQVYEAKVQAKVQAEEKKAKEAEERAEVKAKEAFDRELRLEERRLQRAEAEKGTSTVAPSKPHAPNFKLDKFDDKKDDLDNWFGIFERRCKMFSIKGNDMKAHLYSCLAGKYAEALLAIDESLSYEDTRNALLQRFNLTVDEYRKKFFNLQPRKDETMTGFGQRVDLCFEKWVSMATKEKSYDEIKDLVMSHVLLNSCNSKLVSYWLERDTKGFKNLVQSAEAFFQAHPDEDMHKQNNVFTGSAGYYSGTHSWRGQNTSYPYGKGKLTRGQFDSRQNRGGFNRQNGRGYTSANRPGFYHGNTQHDSAFYRNDFQTHSGYFQTGGRGQRGRGQADLNWRRGSNDVRNDNRSEGDLSIHRGKCCGVENWREVTSFVVSEVPQTGVDDKCFKLPDCMERADANLVANGNSASRGKVDHVYQGLLTVSDKQSEIKVLRDTGASVHAIHEELVTENQRTGKSISLITFGGKIEMFETAKIEVDTPFLKGKIEACILKNNAYPAEHRYYDVLIGNGLGDVKAGDPSEELVSKWLLEHGFIGIANEVNTRGQLKRAKEQCNLETKTYDFDISYSELAELQKKDTSLKKYFDLVDKDALKQGEALISYEIRNGLLIRLFVKDGDNTVQMLVPEELRGKIIALGHDGLWSGHMGMEKTEERVKTSFYWPGLSKDVRDYCNSCLECKRVAPQGKTSKAPLQETPAIKQPFLRCATDIIGPLEVSERKNRYILTLIDYATRWVEATPLKNITADVIVEELMVMFSRIGIPTELLSDGGPQYTASLMEDALKLLGINHSLAAPYHPQTNGLCEKANDTVKQMLRKLSAERPKDWDRILPGVLFAYREVPQATTGFSPFEMVYGVKPRGPLSLLRDLWLKPDYDDFESKTHHQYVLDLRQQIENNCEIASQKTREQQALSKHYFDKKAKERSLEAGDDVLLFLPTSENKLLAKWKGPYKVVNRVEGSDVNYMVNVEGNIKKYHINMLLHCPKRPERLNPYADKITLTGKSNDTGNVCLVVEEEKTTMLNKCATLKLNEINCTQHAACALHATDRAGAVAMVDHIDDREEREGVIPSIVLPPFSQKETYLDVKVCDGLSKEKRSEINDLLYEFRDIFSDVPSKTDCIEHEIHLSDKEPIQLKPYPLPLASEKIVANEVKNMLDADVIQESNSPYSSPIVLVKKKDGSTRFCIDFRKINKVTRGDAHPIPDQEALFSKLAKAKYFTKIDMTKGYWQIGIEANSRQYTAFQAGGKLYEFKRMAFGLKNAPATFNKMMQSLFGNIEGSSYFFDDLTIFHEEWDSHIAALRVVFGIFRKNNLKGRPKKTEVGFTDVPLLGHHVGDGFLKPAEENVKKFLRICKPKNKKQVKSILGLVNYYGKFIPNVSTVLKPLQDLISRGAPERVIWTHDCEQALTSIQSSIFNDPKLLLCNINELFFVQTDASDVGIGGALLQKRDGDLRPCLFISRTLNKHEKNYAIIEKEALAIVWSICKFARYLLCGPRFLLQTDHKPLEFIRTGALINRRIARWALILQTFNFDVEYLPGSDNNFADFLSRNI